MNWIEEVLTPHLEVKAGFGLGYCERLPGSPANQRPSAVAKIGSDRTASNKMSEDRNLIASI